MANAGVFELFARLFVALAVVIGLMMLLARVLRRRGIDLTAGSRRANTQRHHVDLLARRALTRNASVAIVQAGGKTLVLGVTEQQVTLLSEADSRESVVLEEAQWTELPETGSGDAAGGPAWKMALDSLRERTVRKS